ncbi:MAG: hypothetical protein CBE24_03620 [bacterium TMED264]|nr:MAG: hypothetical protein CBE24_03620 [bacterium TMED264]
MAFALTEFKQGLAQGGARSSLFNVEFSYPTSITAPQIGTFNSSELLVKATSIPASTVGSYEVFYHGKAVKVAGDRTFDTWDTTIINDEDFAIRDAIEEWMQLISDHKLNTRDKQISTSILEGENAEYKQDMVVKQFGKDGKVVRKYQFFGAFPTALSAINLDWGTQDIEEFTCTWTYDRWNTIQ